MKIIGLTGGSGTGKGYVGKMFSERGVAVIDTDSVYRNLVSCGSECLSELSNAFGKPGFSVDTHVKRMLVKLGLSRSDDPVKLEKMVNRRMAGEKLGNFSHLLIFHGRAVCHAQNPECGRCVLKNICKTGMK